MGGCCWLSTGSPEKGCCIQLKQPPFELNVHVLMIINYFISILQDFGEVKQPENNTLGAIRELNPSSF